MLKYTCADSAILRYALAFISLTKPTSQHNPRFYD